MDKSLIKILINAKPKEISKLYQEHRDIFLNFGKKYGLDYDDLSDIYQEAFIAIRGHALNGKLFKVKSSFRTYLFGIGKFMIYDLLKEKQKTGSINDFLHVVKNEDEVSYEFIKIDKNENDLSQDQKVLQHFFKKLGKKCQELLTLFYSKGLSVDEIVETSNYNSNGVVRSQKSRCIKQLREMIQKQQ
jgi:RNA polymerase sigma factor (sigma-70 family)